MDRRSGRTRRSQPAAADRGRRKPTTPKRRRLNAELLAAVDAPPKARVAPLAGLSTSEYLSLVASRARSQLTGRDLPTVLAALDHSQVDAALDAFRASDGAGAGVLGRLNFAVMMDGLCAQHGGRALSEGEVDALFARLDLDASADLDFNEILHGWSDLISLCQPPPKPPAPAGRGAARPVPRKAVWHESYVAAGRHELKFKKHQ